MLPTNADYLAVRVTASENIFNDNSFPEFDGHYADNVSLQVNNAVPGPCSFALLGLGAGLAGWMRRRKACKT